MALIIDSQNSTPLVSTIFWSEGLLKTCRAQRNHGLGHIADIFYGIFAAANVATLPVTFVIDPLIRINSTVVHIKVALKTVCKTIFWGAVFFGFYYVAASSCMLLSLHVRRYGRAIAAVTVVYLMHFPLGQYGQSIHETFDAACNNR